MTEPAASSLDLQAATTALASSSTATRIAQLLQIDEWLTSKSLDHELVPRMLRILFDTHALYYDRQSRFAVQKCLVSALLNGASSQALAPLVKAIRDESSKPGIAASSAFVLVEWCSLLMQNLACSPVWQHLGNDILLADADALDNCLQLPCRSGMVRSALVTTRRGFRKLFTSASSPQQCLVDVVSCLTAKDSQPVAKHAATLGIVAGVCARIPALIPFLQSQKARFYDFYIREIVGSRTPVPQHISRGLDDFFHSFSTADEVDKELMPAIEKSLLRSPEVVLLGVLKPLVDSLPSDLDLSKILKERLLKPLLSNVKSSNAAIRIGALAAYRATVAHSHDSAILDAVADEIATSLASGKLTSPDQRVIHAEMLESLSLSKKSAEQASTSLAAVASKEGNEAALTAETSALACALTVVLQSGGQVSKAALDGVVKGLVEKKATSRRLWILLAGRILQSLAHSEVTPGISAFAEAVTPKLLANFDEVVSNAASAAQNGLVVGAFILTSLALPLKTQFAGTSIKTSLTKADIQSQAMSLVPKQAFLLSFRIYSKLSAHQDLDWFCQALYSVGQSLDSTSNRPSALAWSEALIYLISAATLPSSVQQDASQSLSKLYSRNPSLISNLVLEGLWSLIGQAQIQETRAERPNLIRVLRSICLEPRASSKLNADIPIESLEAQASALVVLARPELIAQSSWINMCLRMGLDPGQVARRNLDDLFAEIQQRSSIEQQSKTIRQAACQATAELAFVAPEQVVPRLIQVMSQDLDANQLKDIGPMEAAVFRTPEGTCFIDVLAKKSQDAVPNKNTKDYDILKWEEELRTQLQQKKGQQRKLNAEETAKVNAQIKKESQIRAFVRQVEAKLKRGIGVIEALVTGPPTDATLWLGPAVELLLAVIDSGASLIIGDAASSVFLECSNKAATRLGGIHPFIGAAILRMRGIALEAMYNSEPLEELVSRVLYRLRFAGEQRPFDAVSLIYSFPLVLDVLRKGGVGEADDERDAQLVLAIEFISLHTDTCQNEAIARSQLLAVLIESMQDHAQHYKMIKDCFADACRCIAPNMNESELRVMAKGAIVPSASVRTTVLQSISADVDMSELGFSEEIWLACHDDLQENRDVGNEIWEESGFTLDSKVALRMVPYLESKDAQLRRAAARSLPDCALAHPSCLTELIAHLESRYLELAQAKVQQLDEFGLPRKMDMTDAWEARQGIATAFKELARVMDSRQVDGLFTFLIEAGPLADKSDGVRREMLDAALEATEMHGKGMIDSLTKKLEQSLEQPGKDSDASDRINEAVVIIYGALARHLTPGDAKIPKVMERLLATLNTPSETVQYAIAECLPPLVRTSLDKSSQYFDGVLDKLLTSNKYAVQRGAAYGLAGLVQGRGISSLREYRIMTTLKSAMDNKKEAHQREAALLAFELLSTLLGPLFEPYVIQIVPQLLNGFGDSNGDVRDACLAAAKACFGKLSSYGVKQILPTLLRGLDDQQWRSKRGACDLLGAMAYLDPNQLANSLPDIIPPLTGVLNDSHKEVRAAANRSLKRFGEVIQNPEIKNLVDILLKALSDPTKYTDEALDSLIKVHFVHYLDAPSLALVTRILERGLGDRSNTKRKAAQVIGSLAHLTEKKDIVSHLPLLVAGLKTAAVDPVPTTRATASRALGSLVEKLGEEALPDLIPGLMQTLKADTGAGDRLGSAQALSEVLAGLGTSRLEETLPTILQNVESSKPAVREGFMSLFIFLPVCFGNSFSNYLGRIVPPILAGLADDVESIRETALRAGRLLVKNFAVRAIDLLLPELERGLADDSYRIRLSSVELVGDLLFNLVGIKAAAEDDEEVEEDTGKESSASLKEVLGLEKRNKILSALYVCRCDTSGAVRSAVMSVWKVLVPSPRVLKELVPTITQVLIRRLGSSNMEHKVIASNALGELIRKAGDGVLSSLLPTLEQGLLSSSGSDSKQGICLALRELIASASPEALEDHEKTLISVVRTALTDSDEEVREAAAEAFDSLQQIVGKRVVDQVLPYLLNLLRSEDEANNALSALLTLLTETTRCNMILPNLIPTLTTPPITAFDAKALASLSQVAGAAMNRRLPGIINSLMDNEVNCQDQKLREELSLSFDVVIQSIDEYDGLNTIMNVMLGLLKHEDHSKRAAAARHFGNFFTAASVDYSRYNPDIIRSLLNSFDDGDSNVVEAAVAALIAFTKRLRKEEMDSLVISTRHTLQRVGVPGANLRGFEVTKGVSSILPIFLQGLMNGTAEQRVQASLGISDIVDRTSEASLKPFVTQITGPLIRVVSERATEVKSAVLSTLSNLLEKMPTALKPFLPQLQRTFAKSLADPSSEALRSRAAKALGTLIKYTPRVDPLIAELVGGSKTTDSGVKTAMLKALYEVISRAGANMGETSRASVLSLIDMDADERDDAMTVSNAKLLGALIKNVPEDAATTLLRHRVVTPNMTHSSVLALNAVLVESPNTLMQGALAEEVPDLLCQGMAHKDMFIADNSILATGKVLLSCPPKSFDGTKKMIQTLAKLIEPGNPTDSRRLALVTVRTVSRASMEQVRPHVAVLASPIFGSVRDMVIPVKLAAEAAFVELFNVTDEESRVFDKFLAGAGAELPANTKRSMSDYFKRVALRLGAQARERREAEGGQGGLGLSNDEQEDEREIWSVGKGEVTGEASW